MHPRSFGHYHFSLGLDNWNKLLDFTNSIINFIDVGENKSRIAAVRFSTGARVVFDFDFSFNKTVLQSTVSAIEYANAGTRTGFALDKVTDELLNTTNVPTSGRRSNVPAIVLVITDGNTQEDAATLQTAAQRLRSAGAEVFALGIGSEVNVSELQVIASTPYSRHVSTVSGIESLGVRQFVVDLVLQIACLA